MDSATLPNLMTNARWMVPIAYAAPLYVQNRPMHMPSKVRARRRRRFMATIVGFLAVILSVGARGAQSDAVIDSSFHRRDISPQGARY
jgi:uncharacterized membrane protein YcjF (UPF0283 family)